MKTLRSRSNIVVVDLEESEWVRVLEVPVPSDLIWLGGINMLDPVHFDRKDLGLLIYCIREHLVSIKRQKARTTLDRIADKMENAMQMPYSRTPTGLTAAKIVANNKETALRLLQQAG